MLDKNDLISYQEHIQGDKFGVEGDREREPGRDQEDDWDQDEGGSPADLQAVVLHDDPVPVYGHCHVRHGRHVDSDTWKSPHKSAKRNFISFSSNKSFTNLIISKQITSWPRFTRCFVSPAEVVTVREDPGPGHPVQDGEGDGDGQQEVGECQAEDEDVPGGPHLLGLESGHDDQAVPQN